MTDEHTANAVHTCFPWISSTTLFNRIKAGLLPTESGGKGAAYTFSDEGLIHVGVVDELLSLGAWRSGRFPPEIEIVFHPDESEKANFDRLCRKFEAETTHEKALAFYTAHNKNCKINVDIRHITEEPFISKRRKRANRMMFIVFYPHEKFYPGWGPNNPLLRWDTAAHFSVFTKATIDVLNIFSHVRRMLWDV